LWETKKKGLKNCGKQKKSCLKNGGKKLFKKFVGKFFLLEPPQNDLATPPFSSLPNRCTKHLADQ
jgi:hypothetical protein